MGKKIKPGKIKELYTEFAFKGHETIAIMLPPSGRAWQPKAFSILWVIFLTKKLSYRP